MSRIVILVLIYRRHEPTDLVCLLLFNIPIHITKFCKNMASLPCEHWHIMLMTYNY
jgi:hypothetical protein